VKAEGGRKHKACQSLRRTGAASCRRHRPYAIIVPLTQRDVCVCSQLPTRVSSSRC